MSPTGALTFSLQGWLKTVLSLLLRHSQIKCIVAEDKTTFNYNLLKDEEQEEEEDEKKEDDDDE
jgi:hypothetical protein